MARSAAFGDQQIFGDFLLDASPFLEALPSDDEDAIGVFMDEDQEMEDIMYSLINGDIDVAEPADESIQEIDISDESLHTTENHGKKRFKKVTEELLDELDKHQQSDSTKRNTKWGVNIFEAWCIESGHPVVDLKTIEAGPLAELLRQFYASVAPKGIEKRKESLPEKQAQEYHKNSLKSIRAAINRRLKDLDRNIDISRDVIFNKANGTLNGKLKQMVKTGASRPTQHKKIIPQNDLEKIAKYLHSHDEPEILMYRIWFSLAIHFVSRGLEFHHQLTLQSFVFQTDETGRRYVTLTHDTQQKNIQGGLSDIEAVSDKRMYATGGDECPVNALELFISHCDPEAPSLFCRPKTIPVTYINNNVWYTCKPISRRMFTDFLPKICKNSDCSTKYTAHSLRATAIQILSDAGVELRHIMIMSGHRSEASIRSYSRDCSTNQKRNISDTLSKPTTGYIPQPSLESSISNHLALHYILNSTLFLHKAFQTQIRLVPLQ